MLIKLDWQSPKVIGLISACPNTDASWEVTKMHVWPTVLMTWTVELHRCWWPNNRGNPWLRGRWLYRPESCTLNWPLFICEYYHFSKGLLTHLNDLIVDAYFAVPLSSAVRSDTLHEYTRQLIMWWLTDIASYGDTQSLRILHQLGGEILHFW